MVFGQWPTVVKWHTIQLWLYVLICFCSLFLCLRAIILFAYNYLIWFLFWIYLFIICCLVHEYSVSSLKFQFWGCKLWLSISQRHGIVFSGFSRLFRVCCWPYAYLEAPLSRSFFAWHLVHHPDLCYVECFTREKFENFLGH